MKNILRKCTLLVLVISVILSNVSIIFASAQGDWVYRLIAGGTEVEITDYTGAGGHVIIPATIDNLPVTAIGDQAFYENRLTTVEIPSSEAWSVLYPIRRIRR